MSNRTSRFTYLDTVGAVMLLYMIYGHYCAFVHIDNVLQFIMYPFMPWFFYKAGMFQSPDVNMKKIFGKGVKRLLVPYVTFGFVAWLLVAIINFFNGDLHINYLYGQIGELFSVGALWQNQPLWFLLSLFAVRIIYSLLIKYKCEYLSLCGFGLAFSLYVWGNQAPLWCGNICLGVFFYWLGNKLINVKDNMYISFVSMFLFILAVIAYNSPGSFMENRAESILHYIVYILSSIFGIIAFNYIFEKLPVLEKTKLHVIGRYSMVLYVSHIIIFRIIELILHSCGNEVGNITYAVYFALMYISLQTLAAICLTTNRLRWSIGM